MKWTKSSPTKGWRYRGHSLWLLHRLALGAAIIFLFQGGVRAEDATFYDRPALEELVRHLLLWGPDIKVEFQAPTPSPIAGFKEVRVRAIYHESAQYETVFVSDDGKQIIQGAVFEINRDPFQAIAARISLQNQPRRGSLNAPIKLVVFSDFQCPLCRRLGEEISSAIEKTYRGQVSLYFKDLPLPARHPWAFDAAVAGRCVFHQNSDVFWVYHDWVFAHQSEISAATFRQSAVTAVQSNAIDQQKLMSCIDKRETEGEVQESMQEASALGVPGTPTIFLNGRKMPGPSWAVLRSTIDFELKRKTAKLPADCNCH